MLLVVVSLCRVPGLVARRREVLERVSGGSRRPCLQRVTVTVTVAAVKRKNCWGDGDGDGDG